MEETKLTCAALPLRADESIYALVIGSREGMRSLMGSHTDHLRRFIEPLEWAVKPQVCCLIGDEGAGIGVQEDRAEDPQTFPGMAVRLLRLRYDAGLPGWTILPCAEAEHNAEHLKEAMIACAAQWQLPRGFLRWMLEENRFCSTLTDCAGWLVETSDPGQIPVQEAAGAVRLVDDLAPYRLRRRRMLGGAGMLVAAVGFLCGLGAIGPCMRDEDLRALLGKALTEEMLPTLPFERNEGLEYAARVCAYLENACGAEAWPRMGENLAARFVQCVLPVLADSEKQEGVLPNCLCFALSALIMLYAGVRPNGEGAYILASENGDAEVWDAQRVLAAFSRMSCDMPPESLAYAALSDREVWGCDLREIEGLEDKVTSQLRDMQLLGVREAMKNAAFASGRGD